MTLRQTLAMQRLNRISISKLTSSSLLSWRVRPRLHWNCRLSRSLKHQMGESSPHRICKSILICRSLNRAALAGASLAKERKDLKRMEQNEAADSEARDVNQPWLDPMANPNDKTFASDRKLDQAGQRSAQMPAWKAANKVSSYGKITSMSIQEQRKSLPIYKLRNELVQAIKTVSSAVVCVTLS